MNELDKYGALLEPTIGLPYSTSGGYGPAGLFISPMADYYAAFAPSTYFHRSFIDQAAEPQPSQQSNQQVLATPAGSKELTQDQKDRMPSTTQHIADLYKVLQYITGEDEPYWPKAILIEPEEKGAARNAGGTYFPDRQAIELYTEFGLGYIKPDMSSVSGIGPEVRTLDHELAHFIDHTYRPPNPENRYATFAGAKIKGLPSSGGRGYDGRVDRSILLNQMPPIWVGGNPDSPKDWWDERITSPYSLTREMEEGNPAKGSPEYEIYADQLGEALSLWRGAINYPKADIDLIRQSYGPVSIQDMEKYARVAEKNKAADTLRKIMTEKEVSHQDIQDFYFALDSVAEKFAPPDSQNEFLARVEGRRRQAQIARAILMEMALNRLQRGAKPSLSTGVENPKIGEIMDNLYDATETLRGVLGFGTDTKAKRVLDPITGQLLPVRANVASSKKPKVKLVPKQKKKKK